VVGTLALGLGETHTNCSYRLVKAQGIRPSSTMELTSIRKATASVVSARACQAGKSPPPTSSAQREIRRTTVLRTSIARLLFEPVWVLISHPSPKIKMRPLRARFYFWRGRSDCLTNLLSIQPPLFLMVQGDSNLPAKRSDNT
ncbi:MAG: hypothetical protein RLZZ259_1165, partial [Pseudomonadota bacterium]